MRVVGTQQCHVQTPAWKLEVVRIASEGRNIYLRGEYESQIHIAVILIEPVLAALVEGHGLAFERAGFRLGTGLLASLLQLGERFLARVVGCLGIEALSRGFHL